MQRNDGTTLLRESGRPSLPQLPRALPPRMARAFSISRFVDEILQFVNSYPESRYQWYVGVTADPHTRLGVAHQIRVGEPAKFWDTGSQDIARAVERRLLQLGLNGGTASGERAPQFVYVFLQQLHSRR